MPAPIAQRDIKPLLIKHLLKGTNPLVARVPGQRQAFVKTVMVNGKMTTIPGALPEAMEDMVEAMSDALAEIWTNWQAAQTVGPLIVSIPSLGVPVPNPGTTTTPVSGVYLP
jgi:hypothetical protein